MSSGMSDGLWTEVEPSQFAHERAALDFVRRRLPNREPWRAWSNFTFLDPTGRPSEVDLFVVAPSGLYLIEIKSYPDGRLEADTGTWRWYRDAGGLRSYDNPFVGADGKAKRLKSLLLNQQALRGGGAPKGAGRLWVQALVFLSSPKLEVQLDPRLEGLVVGPDGDAGQSNRLDGVIARLGRLDAYARKVVDRPLSAAIARAMDQAGVRQSERYRQAGSYRFVELLDEGDTWLDYRATHRISRVDKRVRLHLQHRAATEDEQQALSRAIEREFRLLQGLRHPGIEAPDSLEPNPRGLASVYPYDPDAVRLDHWVEQHPDADLSARLELFRSIAEAVASAHDRSLTHRSLSPRSIWVSDPDGDPTPRIRDWSTVAREVATTATRHGAAVGTRHPEHLAMLAGEEAAAYLAPELRTLPEASGQLADVFALGCLLHLLVAGRDPASDADGLQRLLDHHGHVPLAAAMDAAPSDLADLVRAATAADATDRFEGVPELLAFLDLAIDALKAEDEPDLLSASRGTVVEGWEIVARLGAGASAVVYLAERHGAREVLKVARDPDHGERLRQEYEALRRLRHSAIIAPLGLDELAGHTVLRLEPGRVRTHGDALVPDTLAARLRAEGPPTVDFVHRWGTDLLDALVELEREGVDHRDLKPENLVVVERGKNREFRLAVIDFSLAGVSKDDLDVGTVGYLDPFLRDRPQRRWDLHAERYAAGVVLAELATGARPTWGDGVDPRASDRQVPVLRLEGVDAAVVDGLRAFLERALHRNPAQRFDTADDMRRTWERVFAGIDESTGHAAGVPVAELELTGLTATTPVVELRLAPRLAGAIERLGVADVGELARARGEVSRLAGVGAAVRADLRHLVRRLSAAGFAQEPEPVGELDQAELDRLSLDRVAARLVPPSNLPEQARRTLTVLAGLEPATGEDWPTITATARALDVDAAVVTDELDRARRRWSEHRPELVVLRAELAAWLATREGVATATEAAEMLLARRGSVTDPPVRDQRARAVVRACVEAEAAIAQPRFRAVRVGAQLLVALDAPAEVEGRGRIDWAADPLVEAAVTLGERADDLVARDAVITPATVSETLRGVALPRLPERVAFDDVRLVRLAAACSTSAAVSSRGELYRRGLEPDRAVTAARLALLDRFGLTADQLRDRVRARFPAAAELPDRPPLDDLLAEADVGLVWDADAARYRMPDAVGTPSLTAVTSTTGTRYSTVSDADLEVDEVDRLLRRLADDGGFVAATVDPRRLDRAADLLADRLDAARLALDAALIATMRTVVADAGADWATIVAADGEARSDRRFKAVQQVVRRSLDALDRQMREAGRTVVATDAGLLARYGATDLLDRWREDLTRTAEHDGALRGLLLVVPSTDRDEKPTVDGTPVPVVTAGQWTRIPTVWVERGTP